MYIHLLKKEKQVKRNSYSILNERKESLHVTKKRFARSSNLFLKRVHLFVI